MKLEDCFEEFIDYLKAEKNASKYTIENYSSDFQIFLHFLAIQYIEPTFYTINTPVLRKYIAYLKNDKDYAVETIRRKIHSVKSFFNFLYSQEYISKNPTESIHAPKSEDRLPVYLQAEELKKLISVTMKYPSENSLRNKCLIETLAFSGLRRSELLALNWKDIDFKNCTITVHCGKGKKDRIIPVTEPLVSDLWSYLQSRLPLKEDAVFISENGTRLSTTPLKQMFRRYLRLAGLDGKGYTIHKLRHSYASLLLQHGADLKSIQELLGHSDMNSTKIYTHTDMTHLKNQVRKFPLSID